MRPSAWLLLTQASITSELGTHLERVIKSAQCYEKAIHAGARHIPCHLSPIMPAFSYGHIVGAKHRSFENISRAPTANSSDATGSTSLRSYHTTRMPAASSSFLQPASGIRHCFSGPSRWPWHSPHSGMSYCTGCVLRGEDAGDRIQKLQHGLYVCDVPAPVFSVAPGAIVIAYTHNYNWVRRLRNSPTIVYDIVDHLEIYSDFPMRMLRFNQKTLLQQARVVSATADDLLKAILPARPDAVLCPNGVDIDHFKTPAASELEIPADIAPIFAEGKPIIGYYGAVAEWFDFELVKHAAGALDQYNYVLIGPDYDGRQIPNSGIDSVPNIYWLGPKLYRELPAYLRTFAVATIPFKLSEALHAVSPIKLFEYMAGGKPIVTTDLAECRKYPVVAIAHNKEEWVDCLVRAVELRQNEPYLQSLRQTAEDNTWTARCRTVLNALQTAQGSADSSKLPHLVPSTRLT